MPIANHIEQFLSSFDAHLNFLNLARKKAFILTDANINLANLGNNMNSTNYFNNIISNGFLPLNSKSTRIQGNSHSLIDHIITNADSISNITVGTIISDISDHFINFIAIHPYIAPNFHPSKTVREMNPANIDRFKSQLRNLSWNNVFNSSDVNDSLDLFWNDFKTLFDLNFPLKTI
jgi:hypothetical protein